MPVGGTIAELGPGGFGGQAGGYPIPFDPTQMQVYAVNRIHFECPVFLFEEGMEKLPTAVTTTNTGYATEAEATEAAAGKGGHTTVNITNKSVSTSTPFEKREEIITYGHGGQVVTSENTTKITRSVLPIDVTVYARLVGPEGVVWSQSFVVPIRWIGTSIANQGEYGGMGFIDSYTDLNNPLIIFGQQNYALHLFLSVPSNVETNCQLGIVIKVVENVQKSESSPGRFTCFYRSEDRYAPAA